MTTKSTKKITMSEVVETLTGFEEIAISKQFGCGDIDDLTALRLPRALIFIEEKRGGKDDTAAYEAAMSLRIKDVTERFVDDEVGDDPDSADIGIELTAVGNGGAAGG